MRHALFVLTASFAFAQIPPIAGEPKELLKMSIIDIQSGAGAPAKAGQLYKVHYTGWLRDGTKFDSSRDRNEPFTFVQGRRQVIAGWESGFEGMLVGGKRRLLIPYQMAYGEKGSGKTIPPKADLIFDVELLGVEDVPERPAGADIIEPMKDLQKKMVSMLEKLPDDKLDWRPAPGVRSFAEVFKHVQSDNIVWLSMVSRVPPKEETQKLFAEASKSEKASLSKPEMLKNLRDSYESVIKAIEPMRAGALGAEVQMFGQNMTRRELFVSFLAHASEHLGQLIAYERVNGIVPPWSK